MECLQVNIGNYVIQPPKGGKDRKGAVMIEKTAQQFIADAESLLIGAAANDDFVKIHTGAGSAVLISEAEWNILVDAFKIAIGAEK